MLLSVIHLVIIIYMYKNNNQIINEIVDGCKNGGKETGRGTMLHHIKYIAYSSGHPYVMSALQYTHHVKPLPTQA